MESPEPAVDDESQDSSSPDPGISGPPQMNLKGDNMEVFSHSPLVNNENHMDLSFVELQQDLPPKSPNHFELCSPH